MGLTPYRSLKSDGTISDTPASCIRYRLALEWHAYLAQSDDMSDIGVLVGMMGGGSVAVTDFVSVTVTDRWLIRIETEDGKWVLRQVAELDMQVTALVTGIAGASMLGLFTWYMGSERINTTHFGLNPNPPEEDPDHGGYAMPVTALTGAIGATETVILCSDLSRFPASGSVYIGTRTAATKYGGMYWRGAPERLDYDAIDLTTTPHRLTGCKRGRLGHTAKSHSAGDEVIQAPAIKIGADQGVADPGGGSDYTDQYGLVMYDWESPIYQLSVPGGAKVVFAGHSVGRADLPENLDIISTAVCSGPTWAARYIRETGLWWVADAQGSSGIDVRVANDVRCIGFTASPDVAVPQNPLAAVAGDIRATAKPAWETVAGSGSNEFPSLCLEPGSIWPVLVFNHSGDGYACRFTEFSEVAPPVLITSKPIVASCIDQAGTLNCVCVQGGRVYVVYAGLSPGDGPHYEYKASEEFAPVYLDENGQKTTFPTLTETVHRLEIPTLGHWKLLTADGKFYVSEDGGRTWRG